MEYHKEEPLSPVKPMWHTFPAVGVIAAAFGGGTYIAFLQLGIEFQMQVFHQTPLEAGLAWWPQVAGIVAAAGALGLLVRSRFLPLLTLAGMLLLIGGGALLLAMDPQAPGVALPISAAMLGAGAGATVSPELWMAGFSLPSAMAGRLFALVELLRSDADYLLAPVMVKIAEVSAGGKPLTAAGIHEALWTTLWIAAAFTIIGTAIYLLGGAGLPRPDLEAWLSGEDIAFHSPEFGEAVKENRDASTPKPPSW